MNQNFKAIERAGEAPDLGSLSADLRRVTVTSINQQFNFQELLQGAIGAKDAERLVQPQSVPEHATDRALMLRNADIIHLGKQFGDLATVQGVIAGIAISADQFEIRQAAIFAVVVHNPDLADLAIDVSLRDPDAGVREKMLQHLCQEDPLSAISAAVRLVRHDPDQSLRISALELLLDLDTEKALELARELAVGTHKWDRLREYCQRTLERTDLEPFVKESQGHLMAEATEQRSALLSTALFDEATDLCLKAAHQFISRADEAGAVTIGVALLSHRSPKLQDLGYQTVSRCSPEIAELLKPGLTGEIKG